MESKENSEKDRYNMVAEEFENMVLKWSVKDIMNENLFKDKVNQIPERFESMVEYLASFVPPLIEEMRAELHSALESISEAPYAAVVFQEKIQPSKGAVEEYTTLIDGEYGIGERKGKTKTMFKLKDILIISTTVPKNVEDLCDSIVAIVSGTEFQYKEIDSEYKNSILLEVKLYVPNMHPFCTQESNMKNKCFAIYVGNMAMNLRIWNALHPELANETINLAMLAKEVYTNTEGYDGEFVKENANDVEILRNRHFMSQKLNISQTSAIVSAVNAVKRKECPCIKLIQGPPGTGKTSMLVTLIYVLLHHRCRVLVCGPTNTAISEIATRFLNIVTSPSDRCPNTDNFLCIVKLSDLVLVGNEEHLKIEGPLANIFLPYRVERLLKCLHPTTGWRKRVTSLLDFLELAVSQFEVFQKTLQQTATINFLQFVRERLENLAPHFLECARILINDYPGTIQEKHKLECLCEAVENFVNLIQKNAVNEKTLKECFSGHGDIWREATNCTEIFREHMFINKKLLKEALYWKRTECIQFLRKELCYERALPKRNISDICLSHASVVFSTVSSSGKRCMNLGAPFNCLIIDEAAQVKEAESTIALQIKGVKHAFLIGDPKQLPPTVISKLAYKAQYGRSLFERLERLGHPVNFLNIQYRMNPSISLFPNMEFYEKRLMNGPDVEMEPDGYSYIKSEMYGAYAFINVTDGKEENDDFGKSKRNLMEAVVVLYILSKLHKVCAYRGKSKVSVGVISPYRAQVRYLERKLMQKWRNTLDIEVKSIDEFQGGEKDVIIISTVRTERNIGFLSDPRRTNVALTRARFCLWIVGNEQWLAQSNSVWKKIVEDANERKCFLDPSIDNGMVKVIRKAKGQLVQLEDLLNKDSVLFNNTVWKVLFSNEFKKSFTKIKFLQVRQRIISTILNMANGWRKTMKYGGHSDANLINEYVISGLYLLWSTDVHRGGEFMQVLKIWNVLRLEEVPHFRERLEKIFATYTPEYIERCKAKILDREHKCLLPKRWEDDPAFVWYKNLQQPEISETPGCNPSENKAVTSEHAKVEESLLLMKFYSLSSGIANQLLTAQDGSEIDIQFEVNDQESRIVRFPRSLFILGRSGTGKTTVLVIRLLQKEQQAKLAFHGMSCDQQNDFQVEKMNERREGQREDENGSNIRQMFVTVSGKLCSAIRNNIARVDRSVLGKDNVPLMAMHHRSDDLSELENIPDSFIDIPNKNFPLVVTFRKFLMMLDGSVQDHFFDGPMRSTNRKSAAFMKIMRTKEVDYDRFDSIYWPRFSADLTRRLDSSVVFSEIISHIKGSLISINSSNFMMSRNDYILMAESRISILNASQREKIYDLFLLYENKKRSNGDFDIADIVNHLHRQLRYNPYLGQKLDFVYVDEVQDMTISQITLLKYVCCNFHEGYVFAGDTAQAIARGVNFRFEEIRKLFYKEFLAADDKNYLSSKKTMPDLFPLCQNFRTHSGITKVAESITELLYHFFPFAVDKLPPETSLIFGEAPILLKTGEGESLITAIFEGENDGTATSIGGGNFGCGKYEFGAEQVILVRDDHAKEQVLGQVGQRSLVLTIIECKGLEFQDVLLYNFFSTSPLGSKWRVIYEFINEKALNNFDQKPHPKFDNSKHILICSELKYLYVAITRARQRLWIYEEDQEYSVLDYWKHKDLIQCRSLDRTLLESLCVVSSFEDWKQRGMQMFNEKNYEMAIVCFERAGYSHSNIAKWAKAASLQQSGQRLLELDPKAAKDLLRKATECFLSIEKPDLAADCFIIMGDYKEAGKIYVEKFSKTRLEDAGDCFAMAKCWDDAASAYARVNCISKCLDACIKGELFFEGLNFIEYWKESKCNSDCGRCHGCELVNIEIEYLKKSARHYHQIKDTQSMMIFVNAFPTPDLIRSFLLKRDYFDELVEVEAAAGNFKMAAEIAEMKGDLLLEAEMRLKAEQYGLAIKSILFHVQINSFWSMGNKGWPLKKYHEKSILLEKVKQIEEKDPNHVYESLSCELSILSDELQSLPKITEQLIIAKKMRNIRLEILCLRKVLDAHLSSDLKICQLDQEMGLFRVDDYPRMLLENRFSPSTLFSVWDEWKDKLLYSIDALSRYERQHEEEEDIFYLEYALEYFGVRKGKNDRICTVLNSEVFWLKSDKVKLLHRRGKTAHISFQKFLVQAKTFLTVDLYYVGQYVIEKLEKLYGLCTRQNSSLPVQGYLLLQMFEVSETLNNIEHLNGQRKLLREMQGSETLDNIEYLTGQTGLPQVAKFDGALLLRMYQVLTSPKNMEHLTGGLLLRMYQVLTSPKNMEHLTGALLLRMYQFLTSPKNMEHLTGALLLRMYQFLTSPKNMEHLTGLTGVLNDCKERFFHFFFPLKQKTKNIKEFICLREDAATVLILQEISKDSIRKMQRSITLGEIGRLQVVLPFLPKVLVAEYGNKIIECLGDKHYWRDQSLWLHMDTFPEISLHLQDRIRLVKSFETALSSTFNSWEKSDYISPHVFVILLEKLFFLASSFEQLPTGLFLPRSFFSEFMTGKQGEFSCKWLLQSQSQLRRDGSNENLYGALSDIIYELLFDKPDTVKWIEDSNIDSRKYFPEFMLHLIIILCLICVNSTGKLQDYTQLLSQSFTHSEIIENLPFKFKKQLLQALGKCPSNRETFLIDLSQAMRGIDNPLVMIYFNSSHEPTDCHKDIVCLTQESLSCKETVLQAVFPKSFHR